MMEKEVTYASLDQVACALIEFRPAVFDHIFHLLERETRKEHEVNMIDEHVERQHMTQIS